MNICEELKICSLERCVKMIKVDEITAKRNIEEIVNSMKFPKNNYIFTKNKFFTQEILLYNENKIVTFFVKIKKDGKLQKYCYKQHKHLIVHNFIYHFIVSRIVMNEYEPEDFENLKYSESNNKLSFFGNCGYRSFKFSDNDIYGYNQLKQINLIKNFIIKIKKNNL